MTPISQMAFDRHARRRHPGRARCRHLLRPEHGATPVRVFQGIAGGLLGRDSFAGGIPTALLGLAIHFFIAFAIVATYHAASRRIEALARRPVPFGVLHGLAVYFFMNLVVIPLSAIGPVRLSLSIGPVNGLAIHAFGVGLPSALSAALTRRPTLAREASEDDRTGGVLFRGSPPVAPDRPN